MSQGAKANRRSRNILVPFDGSPRSERALTYACATFPDDDVVALHVITRTDDGAASRGWVDSPAGIEEWIETRRSEADREVFADAHRIADRYDRPISTALAVGNVRRAVVDYWESHDFDFLVMDVQGRGLRRTLGYLTGDVSERLARTPAVPAVLVNAELELPTERRSETDEFRVLVPFDRSARSTTALGFACSLFPEADVTALCMHVVWGVDRTVLFDEFDAREARMAELAATAERIAADRGTTVDTVFGSGALDQAVLQFLENDPVDLVVVGTLGKAILGELTVPSASERLVRNCPVPLAIVPPSARLRPRDRVEG
jgi:nucleotide-binding universal stress UspA family protein